MNVGGQRQLNGCAASRVRRTRVDVHVGIAYDVLGRRLLSVVQTSAGVEAEFSHAYLVSVVK